MNTQPPRTNDKKRSYTDPSVCVDHLCGLCPLEFVQGYSCNKVHDLDLQTEYQLDIQQDRSKARDKEHLESLEQFIKNRDNLAKGWRMRAREMFVKDDKAKDARRQMLSLHREIVRLLDERDTFIGKGDMTAADGHLEKVHERIRLKKQAEAEVSKTMAVAANDDSALDVCSTCGYFYLVSHPEPHLKSDQHIAYDQIRKAIDEIRGRLK
ncbi:hypothetical protein O0I10_005902 [Lichtheimia ornata]|uniref:Uncharacterized protein n=1 Tax=Lichtheimia ornata TaxID=688661 RepID=A0AAD7XXJ6_9FUNG|nr:uncharacterized protein O0I10_005902 [Lichtheimia ornata]KAJ8658220.1 hypothetical protein O0I10_005902 [Lichtheimia ornata]